MPKILENIITGAVADPKTHFVTVTWENGVTTVDRDDHLVSKFVFAAFDDPAFFLRISVGGRGRSLQWPDEIDFCADALWFKTYPADAPRQRRLEHHSGP